MTDSAPTADGWLTGPGQGAAQGSLVFFPQISGADTVIDHLPAHPLFPESRTYSILPRVDPVALQSLFKRKMAAADIEQSRTDPTVGPCINRLLQGLFRMIEFEAEISFDRSTSCEDT